MKIPFHTDSTCPSPLAASAKPNCVGPFSNFANGFLDLVFTGMFGIVGMLVALLIRIAIADSSSVGCCLAAVRLGRLKEAGGGTTIPAH